MLKKVLSIILSTSCLLATASSLSVSADETIGDSNTNAQVFVLNEENNGQPPIYYGDNGVVTCGANPPTYSTTLWNLSYNSYGNGEVKATFKHELYTNYCFTFNKETASIHVLLSGSSLFQYFQQYYDKDYYVGIELHEYYQLPLLTGITVYDRTVSTFKLSHTSSNVGHVFTGVSKTNSTSKYYVKFFKPKDGFEISNVDVNIRLI